MTNQKQNKVDPIPWKYYTTESISYKAKKTSMKLYEGCIEIKLHVHAFPTLTVQ
jgi:hypothetical protein